MELTRTEHLCGQQGDLKKIGVHFIMRIQRALQRRQENLLTKEYQTYDTGNHLT